MAFIIFLFTCSSNDILDWRAKPRCLCSLTLATELPLKASWGWTGETFLHENQTSVACLVGSGLNSNFHWLAHWLTTSRSLFRSISEHWGSYTTEYNIVSSAKTFIFDLIFSFRSLLYTRKVRDQEQSPVVLPIQYWHNQNKNHWSLHVTFCY